MIRIFLIDDHEVVRRGVAQLVEAEPDMVIAGEVGSAATAASAVRAAGPDVAIVDLRMGDGNGIEVCRQIRAESPRTAVLMLTAFAEDQAMIDSAAAGASAYVLKQIRGNDLVESIRRVAAGEVLLDSATIRMADRRVKGGSHGLLEQLTPQERRVLDLVGVGRTNRAISEELELAEKTVKNYVTSILRKLQMRSRTEAAIFAARLDERSRRNEPAS